MANTINSLNYANTFADWLVATDALILENNVLGKGDYRKNSGTLYLDGPVLANGVSTFQNQIISQGVGSSVTIDNNTTIKYGTLYLKTLDTSTSNIALVAHGQANVDGLLFANGSGTGLYVLNNTNIGGSLNVSGSETVRYNTITNNLQANTSVLTGRLIANTSVNTSDAYISNSLSVPTADIQNLEVTNQLTVGGNFVLTGDTIYDANAFTINAGSSIGLDSNFIVNRGSSGANARINWSESDKVFRLNNVDTGSFYRIITDEFVSDSITSTSSTNVATSKAINLVYAFAGGAFNAANNVGPQIQPAFNKANGAFIQANAAFARANTSANSFSGTSGSVSPSSGQISFSSNNGLTVVATSPTNLAISTSQDLRTTANPTFNSLTLTSPLGIAQGGTGATTTTQALTNILPTGTTAGYVLTTGGAGNFYWAAGGSGGGGTAIPGTTINSSRLSYTSNGATGYTGNTYAIPQASQSNQVRAYIDGVRQFESEYSLNLNANTITFSTTPDNGNKVLIEVDGYTNYAYYANNIAFTAPFGDIVSSANTIQLAIQDIENRKAALSGATFTGPTTGLTVDANTSNTHFATTAFVKNVLNNSNTYTMSVTGNAGTVTNGVYTSGSYTNPSWISSLANTKVGLGTTSNPQFNSLGIGVEASGSAGELRTTGDIISWYSSDERLKTNIKTIDNALNKVTQLDGVIFNWNELAEGKDKDVPEAGVIAQQVQSILPEVVTQRDTGYLAVRYEKLVPLLIEAIKELKSELDVLKGK